MNNKNQSGFAHLMIVTIILGLGLVGALGYIFYQNYSAKQTTGKDVVKTDDQTNSGGTVTEQTTLEGYLVLEDWGVKFKLPADTGDKQFTYYKIANGNYSFSTKGVEVLGGDCTYKADSYWAPLAGISKITVTSSSEEDNLLPLVAKFGGNNYYYQGAQSACSENNTDLQITDRALVEELIRSIQPK